MADGSYSVKKVKQGPDKGRWGLYKNDRLQFSFENKKAAKEAADRRNKGL